MVHYSDWIETVWPQAIRPPLFPPNLTLRLWQKSIKLRITIERCILEENCIQYFGTESTLQHSRLVIIFLTLRNNCEMAET